MAQVRQFLEKGNVLIFGKIISVALMGTAILFATGCVDQIEIHESNTELGATSGLTCITPTGSGISTDPYVLGTASVCHTGTSQGWEVTYYRASLPASGTWNFRLVLLTGDIDLVVLTGSTTGTVVCSSENFSTSSDTCAVSLSAGTVYTQLVNVGVYALSYRFEIVQ